ncbi:FAD/NAD(P)-binding protein [Actinomycetes bacterium KLBMP 9759]
MFENVTAQPYRIVVVGSGPRGLSVLERMAARLADRDGPRPVELCVIDDVQIGCGRIWRTDQPEWFLMNTIAEEVSAFSGPPDGGPVRPGAGPSLAQWWSADDPDFPGHGSFASRARYGRYMSMVLASIRAALPPSVRLREVLDRVTDLEPDGGRYRLALASGGRMVADRVVLVTGHATPEPYGPEAGLAAFAESNPRLRYLVGDSAADMPLDAVPAGSAVGVIGLGLSFYDVMAAFTLGRGGRFSADGRGGLTYHRTGREPLIVAGSRGGMPVPARGRNQKHHDHRYTTVLCTVERARNGKSHGAVDFRADVLPWLIAEVELVYRATALRRAVGANSGPDAEAAFRDAVVAAARSGLPDVPAIATAHGAPDLPRIDLDRLARPFRGLSFPDPDGFHAALCAHLRHDLAEAEDGNVGSPLKAALDVLRDTRGLIRELVDFGGLTPRSHRDDFLGWYQHRVAFLAAGPPRIRLYQFVALVEAGVLRIAGPATSFAADADRGRFVVSSPQVAGSDVEVDTLVDARIPIPALHRDPSGLTSALRARGIWTGYRNGSFETGGVAVTNSPYHPIGRSGEPDHGLYVLGIPTEHTRWFMQGGSSRPGFWTDFVRDADAIAASALAGAAELVEDSPAGGRDGLDRSAVPTGVAGH